MKLNEVKLGTPVIFWRIVKANGDKYSPVFAVINSLPWTLGHGTIVAKITGEAGGVAITHLEAISHIALIEAQSKKLDLKPLLEEPALCEIQKGFVKSILDIAEPEDRPEQSADYEPKEVQKSDCKKITVTLSPKATKFFNEVMYSLEGKNGDSCTQSEAINEILETNADFESVEDQSVSGWLRDYHNFYKAANLTPAELEKINNYLRLKQTTK